jgi:putative inorganic carbon (HCO3(-)) transporter
VSDPYIAALYLAILIAGIKAPFAAALGYVWVDLSYPQLLSVYLADKPVAMVMGVLAILGYLIADRRAPPRFNMVTILTVLMAGWVTLTCTWAVAPQDAVWQKWDWAFKSVLFSAFIPYVIRSRVRIEAFLQVFVFSFAIHIVAGGLKTLISGGGYGAAFSVIRGNSGLFESSTIGAVAVMIIPILFAFKRQSILLFWPRLSRMVYLGYAALCVLGAVGTFARTALVGLGLLAFGTVVERRRRFGAIAGVAAALLIVSQFAPTAWFSRMETTDTYETDRSSNARVLVWKWTLDFAMDHPLGGGFVSHYVDHITLPDGSTRSGVAFHNAYIEVLGEHGWVGLALFVGTLAFAVRNLWRVRTEAAQFAGLSWCHDLSGALLTSVLVLAGCSMFIGIAFQPMFWYLFATSTCLREYLHRFTAEKARNIDTSLSVVALNQTQTRAGHHPIGAPRPLLGWAQSDQ